MIHICRPSLQGGFALFAELRPLINRRDALYDASDVIEESWRTWGANPELASAVTPVRRKSCRRQSGNLAGLTPAFVRSISMEATSFDFIVEKPVISRFPRDPGKTRSTSFMRGMLRRMSRANSGRCTTWARPFLARSDGTVHVLRSSANSGHLAFESSSRRCNVNMSSLRNGPWIGSRAPAERQITPISSPLSTLSRGFSLPGGALPLNGFSSNRSRFMAQP